MFLTFNSGTIILYRIVQIYQNDWQVEEDTKMRFFTVLLGVLTLASVSPGQSSMSSTRLTTAEINAIAPIVAGVGTSGLAGIRTRVLTGDPTRAGLYTIQLTVPANTTIQSHTHPDDRVSTVISGTWYIGYGTQFDEKKLKALKPGSFYTEPGGEAHFARTGKRPVVIQITGYGPTGTEYTVKDNTKTK